MANNTTTTTTTKSSTTTDDAAATVAAVAAGSIEMQDLRSEEPQWMLVEATSSMDDFEFQSAVTVPRNPVEANHAHIRVLQELVDKIQHYLSLSAVTDSFITIADGITIQAPDGHDAPIGDDGYDGIENVD